jgi:hypothetical protein
MATHILVSIAIACFFIAWSAFIIKESRHRARMTPEQRKTEDDANDYLMMGP